VDPLIAEIAEKYGAPENFERMTTFVRQGASMPSMYYLQSGKVKIEQSAINGKSVLFGFTGKDNWLGDLELFSDTGVANSTVTAVTDVSTIRFSIDSMRRNLERHPALAEMFARSLARKMWAYSKVSTVNLLYPLLDRYAAYLYEMSADAADFPIALETSAGLLGAGERQLQRVVRILAEDGIIARSGRTLTVLDRGRLKEVANDLVNESSAAGSCSQ
jgi:CRP-like cAMP-binding protein